MSRPASFAQHHAIRKEPAGRGARPQVVVHKLYGYSPTGEATLVEPVLEYVLEQAPRRSVAWQHSTTHAIGLLFDYAVALAEELAALPRPQLIERWAHALFEGTISADGFDPSGLFWRGRTRAQVEILLNAVTRFSDWLTSRHGTENLNPWRQASFVERVIQARSTDHRNARSILGHLTAPGGTGERTVRAPGRRLSGDWAEVRAFDEERIWELLTTGFRRDGATAFWPEHERFHLPALLATVAMHGGGLRRSELLHTYVDDVLPDPRRPDSCQLRIYHPEQGRAPSSYVDNSGKAIGANRTAYLRERWGWQPRTLLTDRFRAGFKELLLSNIQEGYADVHWFPTEWGEVFRYFFNLYISKVRSRHCPHPFLLVSGKGRACGEPFTARALQDAHDRAVGKIGLAVDSKLGTTAHAHRHAYGQRLTAAGVDRMVIQRALHHRSLESQEVYTRPSARRVATELARAEAVLGHLAGHHRFSLPAFHTKLHIA